MSHFWRLKAKFFKVFRVIHTSSTNKCFYVFLPWHIFDLISIYFFNHCLDCSNWNYSQLHWASQPCFLIVWQFFDCLFAAFLFSWEPFIVFSKLFALMFLVMFCGHYKKNYSMSTSAGGHIRDIFFSFLRTF